MRRPRIDRSRHKPRGSRQSPGGREDRRHQAAGSPGSHDICIGVIRTGPEGPAALTHARVTVPAWRRPAGHSSSRLTGPERSAARQAPGLVPATQANQGHRSCAGHPLPPVPYRALSRWAAYPTKAYVCWAWMGQGSLPHSPANCMDKMTLGPEGFRWCAYGFASERFKAVLACFGGRMPPPCPSVWATRPDPRQSSSAAAARGGAARAADQPPDAH